LPNPVTEQPVPLPAPLNRLPPGGHRFGTEQLEESNSIVFSWSAVPGADAYIFTLFQATTGSPASAGSPDSTGSPDSADGRWQIIRIPPGNRRDWTLENIAALGNGTFFWQVEAVNIGSSGTIERRGRIAENSFVIDIPRPGRVQVENPGTLYDIPRSGRVQIEAPGTLYDN
jgi:hypothetical protein